MMFNVRINTYSTYYTPCMHNNQFYANTES